MKAALQAAPHPMVAKVAHPQKTRQEKQVKEQAMVKEHPLKEKVEMAMLMAEKVKVIPIPMVRVKVAKAREMVKEKAKVKAEMAHVTLAESRVKNVLAIILPKMAKPNQVMTHKMQAGMAAIPIVIQIPKIPIQMGKPPIQIRKKAGKKARNPKKMEKVTKKGTQKAEIREMKAEKVTVPASHPKTKMP
jgi:hypothetical protein